MPPIADIPQLTNGLLLAALTTDMPEMAIRVHGLAIRENIALSVDCVRQMLQLQARHGDENLVRRLYKTGCETGVYPRQKVSP